MKLIDIKEQIKEDISSVIKVLGLIMNEQDHGRNGLLFMYDVLFMTRRDRSYSDDHPAFMSGKWKRILPFDGSKYTFWYDDPYNANDSHMDSLLRKIKKELENDHHSARLK